MTPQEFKNKRIELGLTQTKLAKELRITLDYVFKIEKGKRTPSWKILNDLDNLVKKSIDN